MARTFTPRVGRLVTYVTATGKPRPAQIVSVGSTNGGIVLRVGGVLQGTSTVGILRGPVSSSIATVVNTWRPR